MIKICKNSRRPLTWIGATHAQKENGPSRQKEEAHTLSAVTGGVTTSKSPLLLVEGHVAALKHHIG